MTNCVCNCNEYHDRFHYKQVSIAIFHYYFTLQSDIPQEMDCLKPRDAKTGAGIAVKEVTMMCQRCYTNPLGVLM